MRWLVRLVTTRGGRVLDPFAGSGATAWAAASEGRRCDLIEREAAYCDHIAARIADLETPLSINTGGTEDTTGQMGLF